MPGEGSASTRWNHANPVIEVSDVQRAIAYYCDVFGLSPSWIWEDRIGGVHADHSSIEIYLSRAERPSPSRLAVFVDDADAAHHKYRTAGADIVDDLKTQPWGLRGFTVACDRDGRPRRLIGLCTPFPLFPLDLVALPHELIPLDIFEERFRAMMTSGGGRCGTEPAVQSDSRELHPNRYLTARSASLRAFAGARRLERVTRAR